MMKSKIYVQQILFKGKKIREEIQKENRKKIQRKNKEKERKKRGKKRRKKEKIGKIQSVFTNFFFFFCAG